MFRRTRRSLSSALTVVLTAGFLTVVSSGPAAALQDSTTSCWNATEETATKLKVEPSNGKAFYIDSGITPKLDSSYLAYRVTNTDSTAKTNLWVRVSNFAPVTGTTSVVSLVNAADRFQQIPSLAAGATKTAFFLIKASGPSAVGQKHLVQVYDRRPDLTGATVQYNCTFTFESVQETIKASANKVDSITW